MTYTANFQQSSIHIFLFYFLTTHLLAPCLLFMHSSTLLFSVFLSPLHHLLSCLLLFSHHLAPLQVYFPLLPLMFFILLLSFSPQFGRVLVSETLSRTITTQPRRPLTSPFTPPTPNLPCHVYPSIYPSIHPLIATIPGLLLSHSWSSSGFSSLPTTQLCMCVISSVFLHVFLCVTFD